MYSADEFFNRRKPTNGDAIRAMSDEDLAKYLTGYFLLNMPKALSDAYNNALDWLKQEVET